MALMLFGIVGTLLFIVRRFERTARLRAGLVPIGIACFILGNALQFAATFGPSTPPPEAPQQPT